MKQHKNNMKDHSKLMNHTRKTNVPNENERFTAVPIDSKSFHQ